MITERLRQAVGSGCLFCGEMLSEHTTFRTGGPAAWYVRPDGAEQICRIIQICREEGVPYYILGRGSNMLVSDRGYEGVIIEIGRNMSKVSVDGDRVTAEAGAALSAAAAAARDAGLTGLEFASGIPGSVGGAVFMNAGAYGGEIAQVLVSAEVLTADGEVLTVSPGQLDLSYRHSSAEENGWIILSAVFSLSPEEPSCITARMEELNRQRREKQPLEYPSAGSTFKRPEGYFAGKLIQDSGLRGFRTGGAMVSEKHCGFVINCGGASSADIYRLTETIIQKVRSDSGVVLEREVRLLGDFTEEME